MQRYATGSVDSKKLTFGGGKIFLGVQKLQEAQKVYKKNQKKVATSFLFFWRQ